MMGVRIRGVWLTDPRDGKDHAWNEVVDGGRWKARCPAGIVAEPKTLAEPEDEFGRCDGCVLALALDLGSELVDQLPPDAVAQWQRGL